MEQIEPDPARHWRQGRERNHADGGCCQILISFVLSGWYKHVTLFSRSRRAPGAGHPQVKAAFASAAKKTLGIQSRSERNAIVASAVRGTGPGVVRKKSRAKVGSPLYGKVYEYRTK